MRQSIETYKKQFERTGWKLRQVIHFDDDKKSANYFFTNGNDETVLFCENGIVKDSTRFNGK